MERSARIIQALERDEGPSNALDGSGKRSLWVFEAIAHCRHRYGHDAIGPYVVNAAQGVDDILAVLLLARWADTADRRSGDVPIDVAPLFESADTLERCGSIMTQLFKETMYRRHLLGRGNHQYVMMGYATSNKENGIVQSRWLIRKAQELLFAAADEAGVDLTLFHGRGGGPDRGGGRTEVLVRSGPTGARRGRLRITEQGELLKEKYGLRPIALRVFEQSFNTLCLASAGVMPPEQVSDEWRTAMEQVSAQSARSYRALVYGDRAFYDFFRQVTPIDVIEQMQLGSRPATEMNNEGVSAIRSIPWSHAWSQCRYMITGWFGAGTALATARAQLGPEILSDMYRGWFFFRNLIDEIELSLARSDLKVAAQYDDLVDPALRHFIPQLRSEYLVACEQVLALRGSQTLLDHEPTVQRSIMLRNPYIDPMHLVQVDLLKRWRAGRREDRDLLSALLASVSGIGQALQGA
jgi:phosphoenolpyruvate carboxylase